MGYTVILEQEPGGRYLVHALALPGCVSQGDTREEALVNIREANGTVHRGLHRGW